MLTLVNYYVMEQKAKREKAYKELLERERDIADKIIIQKVLVSQLHSGIVTSEELKKQLGIVSPRKKLPTRKVDHVAKFRIDHKRRD